MSQERVYLCMDLKSFYASVECVERKLDPMKANLVVADPGRTETTLCLAVSPAMKAMGVPGRCRVYEIPPGIAYEMAPPRMQLYIDYSAKVYGVYLKYLAAEDIHVYSIDEAFMDVTDYLGMYRMSAKELGARILQDVLETTGIPAAVGIGTNLYLAKIALDLAAKRTKDQIAFLDERSYRETLWDHKPLEDFWRVGPGIAARLARAGITTMRQVAEADEGLLLRMFGVDAELLIDHAWGRESVTMADIKAYRPKSASLSSGQVLSRDYTHEEGRLVVKEMADLLSLELVEKRLAADSLTLHVGYAYYLQKKPAHGTVPLGGSTSSARQIIACAWKLYEQISDPSASVRRITLTLNRVRREEYQQYDLFTEPAELEREYRLQRAMLDLKEKFGKNAVLKGMNLLEGATTRERNRQIGGHRSGV